MSWVRTNRSRRCPVCDKPDYCTIATDGMSAHCMRIESAKSVATGGWIHKLSDPIPQPKPKEAKKLKDVSAVARKMFLDPLAGPKRAETAKTLGVSVVSLWALRAGIGWDYNGTEFTSFPSRDACCKVTGITRRYADGTKKTLAGTSNSGVFVPSNWWQASGPVIIVEGASDVAALTTHGFPALGRPSNVGGARIISAYLSRRARGRRVVVIGENDRKPDRPGTVDGCKKDCPGCAWCWPGRDGAVRVARSLGVEWRMIPSEFKDVRQWSNKDRDFRPAFAEWISSKE